MAKKSERKKVSERIDEITQKAGKKRAKKAMKKGKWIVAVCILVVLAVSSYLINAFLVPFEDLIIHYITSSKAEKLPPLGDNDLRVTFFDVGQGDCIFIEFPDGKTMLIDGGDSDGAVEYIIKKFDKTNIKEIDYVMLTHSDKDHCGGLDSIIDYKFLDVKTVYMPKINTPSKISKTYENFVNAVKKEKSNVIYSLSGMEIISNDMTANPYCLTILSPTEDFYDTINNKNSLTAEDKNNVSPIMLLEYNGKKLMFTGDAPKEAELSMLEDYENGVFDEKGLAQNRGYNIPLNISNIDLLKVAHHGSSGSSCQEFLNATSPDIAVISVGAGNSYGHPHDEALDRLSDIGAKINTTEDKGSITATVLADEAQDISLSFSQDGDSVACLSISEILAEFSSMDVYLNRQNIYA